MNTLANLWSVVTSLLNDGYSVIPIRDKDEIVNDKTYTKKSPYTRWEKFQTVKATKEELYYMLEKYGTFAIATICGNVSGNLEGIDVDSKWLPEIVKPLFEAIKQAFPDIKFRIIRTPSKGYHIVYRVSDGVIPPNKKLAGRYSTEEELKENPKGKVKYFIETRGENGYLAAYPTEGYELVVDVQPPVITWQQRCDLIAICESFNQIVKQDTYKPTKQENVYYSTNPFEHYNKSAEGEQVLLNNGWKYHSRNSKAIYFIRPGSKSGGIHAAYLLDTRLYKFFTSNCEFENEGKLYSPSSVKAILEFNGDKKRMFPELVKNGYGVINAKKEYEIVKKAAITGAPLPANVSETAKEVLNEKKQIIQQKIPYGIFWTYSERGKLEIDIESFCNVANSLGFRSFNEDILQIVDSFIYRRNLRQFQDTMKDYIYDGDAEVVHEIKRAYEIFLKHWGEFSAKRLMLFDDSCLLKDTRDACYKFYSNGYVKIERDNATLNKYEDLKGKVMHERVRQREFSFGEVGGKYVEFLRLACRYDVHTDYIEKIIGYLSHEYKDSTTGYIIVQVEECENPKDGGGSGKNVFVQLLENTTTLCSNPGEQVKFDERFLQAWDYQKIFYVSDVPERFTFVFLKDLSTNDAKVKRLYKDEIIVKCADMCKFVIGTNYSYETKDGGLKRRIIPIEFTDFFTKAGGIDSHFGCLFPLGWTQEDWQGFDNMVIKSVQTWLNCGLKLQPLQLSEGGKSKQFEQTYGEITRTFFQQNWPDWAKLPDYFISNTRFKEQYDTYFKENELNDKYKISPQKMNKALADWCKENDYEYAPEQMSRERDDNNPYGKPVKGRKFLPKTPPF